MYTSLLIGAIFLVSFGLMARAGLWSNTLLLFTVITAGLLATNYFESLAGFVDEQQPSMSYIWDFVSVWLLFIVAAAILRAIFDQVSKVKVRFPPMVDLIGGILMALWTAWVFTGFATMTLHTAPLARNPLAGSFQSDPEEKMFFGTAPDRVWLAWVHRESLGSLSRLGPVHPFDPRGDFVLRYAARRAELETVPGLGKGK